MSASPALAGDAVSDALADAVAGVGLETVFQPVADLASRKVVAYEALSRWPAAGVGPEAVFAAARARGQTGRLDQLCRRAAVAAARRAGLGPDVLLLVNVEPGSIDLTRGNTDTPTAADDAVPRTVVEFTERDLLLRPATLLAQADLARRRGHGIALDDVGAHPDSLALLDLLMPDIVKLDLALIQHAPARDRTRTLAAVMAHRERTGVVVLAEGIETPDHLARALSLGATVGQGWLIGRPGPLPPPPDRHQHRLELGHAAAPTPSTPAELIGGDVRTADKQMLLAFSRHIEAQADNLADPAVVIAALQSVDHISDATRDTYSRLARRSPFVALLGVGVTDRPAPGVRGADLRRSDPLRHEWTVAALGAQTSAALIARDCGQDLPEAQRRFDFVVTYDRDLVTRAMRSLLSRVA